MPPKISDHSQTPPSQDSELNWRNDQNEANYRSQNEANYYPQNVPAYEEDDEACASEFGVPGQLHDGY